MILLIVRIFTQHILENIRQIFLWNISMISLLIFNIYTAIEIICEQFFESKQELIDFNNNDKTKPNTAASGWIKSVLQEENSLG